MTSEVRAHTHARTHARDTSATDSPHDSGSADKKSQRLLFGDNYFPHAVYRFYKWHNFGSLPRSDATVTVSRPFRFPSTALRSARSATSDRVHRQRLAPSQLASVLCRHLAAIKTAGLGNRCDCCRCRCSRSGDLKMSS
jgi:hypothetical protein